MCHDYNGISVIGQKPHPLYCYTYFWEKVHLIFRKLKKKKNTKKTNFPFQPNMASTGVAA